jgi:chromosome segregation ATPase
MLVRFFRSSRDKWKQKYMDVKTEIKRYKNRAADAGRSRDQWKTKARELEEKTHRLEDELTRLQAELDANKNLSPR